MMLQVFAILLGGAILVRIFMRQGNQLPRGSNKFRNRFDR